MPNKNFLNNPPTFSLDGIISAKPGQTQMCYLIGATTDHGMWTDVNPLSKKLPMFIVQIIIIITLTRIFLLLAKPLRQPQIVADLMAGLMLGPSFVLLLPESTFEPIERLIFQTIFHIPRIMMMETVANLGLNYYLFFLGLEMDLTAVTRVGNKALSIGISGSLFPFLVGCAFYYFGFPEFKQDFALGCLFWGVVLSVTGLQPVGELLLKHKLLHSEFGRVSLSSALVNGIVSWTLLLICIAVTSSGPLFFLSLLVAIFLAAFYFYVVRPVILSVIKRTQEGEEFSESTICVILTMVLFCSLLSDICGLSSMYGAFVLGLIIPKDALGQRFLVVLQGFVSDLLMPLFYACVGMRTHMSSKGVKAESDNMLMVGVAFISFLPKITTTLAVSYMYKIPIREGIALGVLMNVKGLVAPIALVWGRDRMALNHHGYTVMVICTTLMTIVASPILGFLYKQKKHFSPSKHRTLGKLKPDAELRILACTHELQTVAGITALIEASNATRRSPICLFALQLVHLAKSTTALLVEHGSYDSGSPSNRRIDRQTDQMIASLEKLEQQNNMITVQPLTVMSDYSTMHEDVCNIAEEKCVTMVILPFHRRQTVHNRMEDANPVYREINENIFTNAPCSVCVLVDRGIGIHLNKEGGVGFDIIRICMVYIGGADDREALTLAWRMAGHSKAVLTVIRLIPSANSSSHEEGYSFRVPSVKVDIETEKHLDDEFTTEFRQKSMDKETIKYFEKESENAAETVAILKSVAESYDIFIVGRRMGTSSPITAGLEDWSEHPDLGCIGDLLISSDFPSATSVLVVQQYASTAAAKGDEDSSLRGPQNNKTGADFHDNP